MNDENVPLEGPFLTIDRDGFVHVMAIRGGRGRCNYRAYRSRCFDDVDIYDRSRRWFKIRSAAWKETSIWKKVVCRCFNRVMAVDLDVEFQRRVNLEDIVKAVVESLQKDEGYWSEVRELDELIDEISAARDIEAVMASLGGPD